MQTHSHHHNIPPIHTEGREPAHPALYTDGTVLLLHSNPFTPGKSGMARPQLLSSTFDGASPQESPQPQASPAAASSPAGRDNPGESGPAPPQDGSTTWTSSSGEYGVFSEGDDLDNREGFVDEYNRIAKKV